MARRNRGASGSTRRDALERNHYKRKENNRSQRLFVIIACEGIKTEKHYFEAIFQKLRNEHRITNTSCIIVPHNHTNPTGVVKDLLDYHDEFRNTYKQFDEKWVVFDRDEERTNGGGHTLQDFNAALKLAHQRHIDVAYSNPCFEIWYLLHFFYYNTPIDRDRVIDRLEEIDCLNSTYNKNDSQMFAKLESRLHGAVRNAERLDNVMEESGSSAAEANPKTTVYKLVRKLLGIDS
jgi:RloB-like protein